MAASSFWEPIVSFDQTANLKQCAMYELKNPSFKDTKVHHLAPTRTRKSRWLRHISTSSEALQSVGIPIFNEQTYDNGYLYSCTVFQRNNKQDEETIDHASNGKEDKNEHGYGAAIVIKNGHITVPKTLASFRSKRKRTGRVTHQQQQQQQKRSDLRNRYNPKRNQKTSRMATVSDSGDKDEDGDLDADCGSFYESECNDSGPFTINTSRVKVSDLSNKLIKSLAQNNKDCENGTGTRSSKYSVSTATALSHQISSGSSVSLPSLQYQHISSGNSYRSRARGGRGKSSSKRHRKLDLSSLDALTLWFYEHTKRVTLDLIHHEKATYFISMEKGVFGCKDGWNDVIKQNVDLETINQLLLFGHYFNDETYVISSYRQWKSDIKTVFENVALLLGPETVKRKERQKRRDTVKLMEIDGDEDEFDTAKLHDIYRDCQVMLCYFSWKLVEMQKQIKKLTKKADDWSSTKRGKYSQYEGERREIVSMIYDAELDDCKFKEIQETLLVHISQKRKLQLKNRKYSKKDIDLLPHRVLYKLARCGDHTKISKPCVNVTAISNQKKIFWAQYTHSKNSLQAAVRRVQKDAFKDSRTWNNYNSVDVDVYDFDDDDQEAHQVDDEDDPDIDIQLN